jgi:16S rRNA (guanine527-N7)-methyltransferase
LEILPNRSEIELKEPLPADIASILAPYYLVENQSLIGYIRAYIPLLLEWNEKISLTKITEPVEIVKFQFGESLVAASALKMRDGRLADVGSGAGFPGLPLAMAIPGVHVTLIEANAKKAAFLFEVARRLDLSNITVLRSRMEDVKGVEPFNFICARAVGKYANVARWSRGKLSPKGRLVLFLGKDDVQTVREMSHWNWESPIGIPNSSRRFVLSGSVAP